VTAGLAHGLAPGEARVFSQRDLDALDAGEKGRVSALVAEELRANRFDPATETLALSKGQVAAVPELVRYYTDLWSNGSDAMSIPKGVVKTAEQGRQLTAFFFWTAWAAGTNRPGETYTYTANWPFDPLVGNRALPSALVWSIASVVLLILGIGLAIYLYMRNREEDEAPTFAPLAEPKPTASQRATLPYFLVALVLFLLQAVLGSVTGHYAVEGNKIFGVDLTHLIPYAATRTWHLQLAVFWIATCWLATGLVIGPVIGGKEPRASSASSSTRPSSSTTRRASTRRPSTRTARSSASTASSPSRSCSSRCATSSARPPGRMGSSRSRSGVSTSAWPG
jgi:nitric oxide reductase subunit B